MKNIVLAAAALLAACGSAYENADLEGCKGTINNRDVVAGKLIVKDGYVYRLKNTGGCIKFVGELQNADTWHEDEEIKFCYEDYPVADASLPSDPAEAKCSLTVEATTFCDGAENTPVYRCSAPDITAADLGW